MTNFKTLILYMEYLHPLEEGSEINNHSFTIGMPFDTPRPSKVYKSIPEESLRGFYNGEKFSIREITPNIDYNIMLKGELFCKIILDKSLNQHSVYQYKRLPETSLRETMHIIHYAHSLVLDYITPNGVWLNPSS